MKKTIILALRGSDTESQYYWCKTHKDAELAGEYCADQIPENHYQIIISKWFYCPSDTPWLKRLSEIPFFHHLAH